MLERSLLNLHFTPTHVGKLTASFSFTPTCWFASLRLAKVAQDSHLHLTTCPTAHMYSSVRPTERQRHASSVVAP